jgi:ElaB/YqjD/DUF883 family membrane-anchored ribosome-binding protein
MTSRKNTGGADAIHGSGATGATAGAGMPAAEDPDAIRADIGATRAELGDSVTALAEKADVKARAQEGVAAAKGRFQGGAQAAAERAKGTARQVGDTVRRRPAPVAAGIGTVAAAVGALVVIRRRRSGRATARTRVWGRRRWTR